MGCGMALGAPVLLTTLIRMGLPPHVGPATLASTALQKMLTSHGGVLPAASRGSAQTVKAGRTHPCPPGASPCGNWLLDAPFVCRACNLGATLAALGLFVTAVLVGLLLWGFVVLPAVYYATTRRSPAEVYRWGARVGMRVDAMGT